MFHNIMLIEDHKFFFDVIDDRVDHWLSYPTDIGFRNVYTPIRDFLIQHLTEEIKNVC